MKAASVLLFMPLVGVVAGMCFDNKTASPPREVVRKAHVVGSIEVCKADCFDEAYCLAFSYNPISKKCVHLGAVKEGTCVGKGFYPYVKCAGTENCDYFSEETVSFAKSGGGDVSTAFPKCQVRNDYVSVEKVCGAPPSDITCEHGNCFCKNPNQQLVVKSSSWTYCGVRAICAGGNKYKILSPSGLTTSLEFSMSEAVCTTIARTSYEKCMCDMPFINGGIRDGDRLCGGKKIKSWGDNGQDLFYTNLECTPAGWISDGVKIVKPEYVRCEKFA